jgi:hypothetical protein
MRYFLFSLLMAAPVTAFANPTVYVCDTQSNRQNGAIQDQIVFAHDAAKDEVFVSDLLIQGVVGGPLSGEVASDNDTRVVFSWTLRNVPNNSGQVASLAYRATLFKATGKIDVSVRPLNYDNSFSATGTCATQ